MSLLSPTSRRFTRRSRYSHEQQRDRIESVRERIELTTPAGLPGRTNPTDVRR